MIGLGNILGLLGLLGIVALIIIYIIRPNYQQRMISSTYVWKQALKYRRKRITTSKLRNILIILCQVLILASCAIMLARPFYAEEMPEEYNEKIIVIESSASMWAKGTVSNTEEFGQTRFERAVNKAREKTLEVFEEDGAVSIILAGMEPELLCERADRSKIDELDEDVFNNLVPKIETGNGEFYVDSEHIKCSYGTADIEAAMLLAENLLRERPQSEVILYTGAEYMYSGNVTVENVAAEGDWNIAILGGEAKLNEQLMYSFSVDVAVYGRPATVEIAFEVFAPNGGEKSFVYTADILPPDSGDEDGSALIERFDNTGEIKTITLNTAKYRAADDDYIPDVGAEGDMSVMSYSYARAYIKSVNSIGDSSGDSEIINDSIESDNAYYFFGGSKNTLDVYYYSLLPNPFMTAVFSAWQHSLQDKWNINVRVISAAQNNEELQGYDLYIFEHIMPHSTPTDGVVLFLDPATDPPIDSGVECYPLVTLDQGSAGLTFTPGAMTQSHPMMKGISPSSFAVWQYRPIKYHDGFEELMYCQGNPTFIAKNTPTEKISVLSFNVNRGDPLNKDFNLLMLNFFNYYFPETISDYIYEVGDTVTFNAIAGSMSLRNIEDPEPTPFSEFPAQKKVTKYGVYTLEQEMLSGETMSTSFFVKTPSSESDIDSIRTSVPNPYARTVDESDNILELLIFIAAAMFALVLLEWWLHSRTQM